MGTLFFLINTQIFGIQIIKIFLFYSEEKEREEKILIVSKYGMVYVIVCNRKSSKIYAIELYRSNNNNSIIIVSFFKNTYLHFKIVIFFITKTLYF